MIQLILSGLLFVEMVSVTIYAGATVLAFMTLYAYLNWKFRADSPPVPHHEIPKIIITHHYT